MKATIGVLGGMGPSATVDFMQKIIAQTEARCDQEHIPLLVLSIPQIPDRTACLISNQASPLPALLRGVNTLINAGVGCIAMPCNTAHNWYEALALNSSVPILHIAKTCAEKLNRQGVTSAALLATDGTLKTGIYLTELAKYGIKLSLPDKELQKQVMTGIYMTKSGLVAEGGQILERCVIHMLEGGVQKVILGCTEIPLAFDKINSTFKQYSLDTTQALAASCIAWHQRHNMTQVVSCI